MEAENSSVYASPLEAGLTSDIFAVVHPWVLHGQGAHAGRA